MRESDESADCPARKPVHSCALSLMEQALALLDEAEAPGHVAAHLQTAIDCLREVADS